MLIMVIPESSSEDNTACFPLKLFPDTSGFLLKEPTCNSLQERIPQKNITLWFLVFSASRTPSRKLLCKTPPSSSSFLLQNIKESPPLFLNGSPKKKTNLPPTEKHHLCQPAAGLFKTLFDSLDSLKANYKLTHGSLRLWHLSKISCRKWAPNGGLQICLSLVELTSVRSKNTVNINRIIKNLVQKLY